VDGEGQTIDLLKTVSMAANTLDFTTGFIEFGTTPATTGDIRLENDTSIVWRDSGNTADFGIKFNVNEQFQVDGTVRVETTSPRGFQAVRIGELANGDSIGSLAFQAEDGEASPVIQNYVRIQAIMENDTAAAEQGKLIVELMEGGTPNVVYMQFNDAGGNTIQIFRNLQMAQNTIDFDTDGHSITPSATALTYDTGAAGDDHIFQSAGATDFRISGTGSAFLLEKASADADVSTFGQLWVLNTTPQALMFTDEAGVDSNLTAGVHDIPTSASSWFAPTLEPATGLTNINFATNDHDYKVWEFTSTAADERIQLNTTLPRNVDLSDIDIVIKWSFASGSGDVRWGIRAVGMGDNDALDSAWGTPVEANDTAGTANQFQFVTLSALAVGGTPGEGDEIAFELYREGSDGGDTFTGTARLHSVTFRVRKVRASAAV
jgi:hypothetical protein